MKNGYAYVRTRRRVFHSSERRGTSVGEGSRRAEVQKSTIAPMLSVRNGAKAGAFYKAAFGAGELFRIEDEA